MQTAILIAAVLLATGMLLRGLVRPLRSLYIPAAVVGGLVGFVVVQILTRAGNAATFAATDGIVNELKSWPTPLIAVVFAGLLLEKPSAGGFVQAMRRGVRSGSLAWIIILGQIVIGLLVFVTLVKPFHAEVPASFGQLLEVSWAGGHGTSGAMGAVYAGQGFPAGRDLAFFLATVGLIYGVTAGLVLVNVAIRRGWTAKEAPPVAPSLVEPIPQHAASDKTLDYETPSVPTAVSGIDALAIQVVILALAFGAGLLMQLAFVRIAQAILPPDDPASSKDWIDSIKNLPLFLFTLLGGWLVRQILMAVRLSHLIDMKMLSRLQGVAMEFLIVAAITTMRVEALGTYFLPAMALIIGAAVWSIISLFVLAPRLLPRAYWFELGLLNYGFSTANTPQGFMLLRIVDPQLKTNAAEDYAVAAPLSAPFIGGGILTFALPLVLDRAGAWVVMACAILLAIGIYVVARWLSVSSPGTPGEE